MNSWVKSFFKKKRASVKPPEYVIVGLGNPGRDYEMTRHNAGFLTIDVLSQRHGIKLNDIRHKGIAGWGMINNARVMLFKPQTFMNRSGESLYSIVENYGLSLDKIIVIYDDIDLTVGKLRIRPSGSAGTHNGMRSIIHMLKQDSFPRIRIGIGPKSKNKSLADFVLSEFALEDGETVTEVLNRAADGVETIITSGVQMAMSRHNG